jgi:hypothetical protein
VSLASGNDDTFRNLQMSESEYDIRTLLQSTAEAVVTNQQSLDRELGHSYLTSCQTSGVRTLFSIPRTHLRLRFGVVETASGEWRLVPLKWFFNKGKQVREQMHTHELEFYVDASPHPPPPLQSDEQSSPIPVFLTGPFFMLSFSEEAEIAKRMIAALDPQNPSWSSVIPGSVSDLAGKVKREREKFIDALTDNSNEQGPIFFRYDSSPTSYLIVRVVGSDANDSIFVVTPGTQPEVVIHSMDGDEVKMVRYQPLHSLLETMRGWQNGVLPPHVSSVLEQTVTDRPAESESGLRGLLPFAQDIREGYAEGIKYLSKVSSTSTMDLADEQLTPNVYFDLTGVQAALTYSVGDRKESPRGRTFDFMVRRTWSGDDTIQDEDDANETRLIESRAFIRASNQAGKARVEIELQTPEFVLSGAARERLLRMAVNSIDAIAEAFRPDQAVYHSFLENPTFQKAAVALLSYRGEQAKDKFFVIWPGLLANQSRNFAFICALDKDEPTRLTDVKAILRVDQDLTTVELPTVTGEQYGAFHNFFHAVRMWRVRMTSP